MNNRVEATLSALLTVAALAIAAAIVKREFFGQSTVGGAGTVPQISRQERWDEILNAGITVGDAAAPIRIVEFTDFQCPVCRSFEQVALAQAKQKYGDRIAITYVHFPLPNHEFARPAAKAAECAAAQGKFADFVAALFTKQDSLGKRPWSAFAGDANVADSISFATCLAGAGDFTRVDSGFALAERLNLRGTPTVMINGWRFQPAPTPDRLTGAVEALLAGKKPAPE